MKAATHILFSVGLLLLCSVANALPSNEYALVIGNSSYENRPLANPVNDARLIAASLQAIGFKVTVVNDLGRKELFSKVSDFAKALPKDSIALVYYAGHGLQIEGKNFLLPTDFSPTSASGVALRAYPVSDLLLQVGKAASSVNIVVLDACRNNPFQPTEVAKYRSFDNLGLAPLKNPKGTLIAFSTAPGQQAADGVGRQNSLYAEFLAKALVEPGVTAEQIFKKVAEQVRKKTIEDQQPWFESSLVNDLVFLPPLKAVQPIKEKARVVVESRPKGLSDDAKAPIVSDPQAWYFNLTPAEWAQLESEIHKRVDDVSSADVPLLEYRAEKGNVVAQTTLGLAYQSGVKKSSSVDANRDNANDGLSLKWLHKAAAQGFPIAQVELGDMFYSGVGANKDVRQANFWFREAARSDYPRALTKISELSTKDTKSAASATQEFASANPLLHAAYQADSWLSVQGMVQSGDVNALKIALDGKISLSPEGLGEVYSPFISSNPPNAEVMISMLEAASFHLKDARLGSAGNSLGKVIPQIVWMCKNWADKSKTDRFGVFSPVEYSMTPMAYAVLLGSKSGVKFAQEHGATDMQANVTCTESRQGRPVTVLHHFSSQEITQTASD